jgi:hypothetical protein
MGPASGSEKEKVTMHIKMVSKPACAAAGFDPAAIITAKATMVNALVNLFQIQRFFGINLNPKVD